MMAKIKELDVIRTLVPLEGPDVFDDTRVYQLPVGSEGTVVFDFGKAFEVEFLVHPTTQEDFRSVQITVEAAQCELVRAASN